MEDNRETRNPTLCDGTKIRDRAMAKGCKESASEMKLLHSAKEGQHDRSAPQVESHIDREFRQDRERARPRQKPKPLRLSFCLSNSRYRPEYFCV